MNYDVNWTVRNGSLRTLSDFVGKKSQYETTVMIPEGNVKCVTFNLTWTDDRMTVLKRMGLDSMTLEVTMPDGIHYFTETNTSAPITGKGSITYTIVNQIIPPTMPIKADNEKDAQAKLIGKPYLDDSWTGKDININISVHIGEIRILKKIRDKGNDFDLKITYQYYDGTLKMDTTKNTGGDSSPPPDDIWTNQDEPPYISMIINTGCGRFV
jgi:hypothetical protein